MFLPSQSPIVLEACEIDLERRVLVRDGERHRLSSREVEVLTYLLKRPGRTISKAELEREVWEFAPGIQSAAVGVAMRRLRSRIERDPKNPVHLHTVRNVGWSFILTEAPEAPLGPRHNLAASVDRFVGRATESDALREALAGPDRLISLVGPPGVGKTRLAHEVIEAGLQADGLREAWWLSLADDRTFADPAAALATAMGLGTPSRIGAALAARGAVLIAVDDAERLTADHGPILQGWLAGRNVELLLIGRARSGLSGERLVRLDSLRSDEGARLFLSRVHALRPGFAATPADVEPLVALLDGLPLAIELAAAQARILDLPSLQRRIENGSAAGPLADALSWSWNRLSETQQAALARCAVFAGGFDLAAAEAVLAGVPGEAADLLAKLVDRSLVRIGTDGGVRFTLSSTIRAHVLREAGEDPTAASLHRAWVLTLGEGLVEGLYRQGGIERLQSLRRETANLTRARQGASPDEDARLAVVLATVAFRSGEMARRLSLLEAVVVDQEGVGTLSPAVRLALLTARAAARVSSGRIAAAGEDQEVVLHTPHPALDQALRTSVRWSMTQGDVNEARRRAKSALARDNIRGSTRVELLGDLAVLEASERRWGAARSCCLEAIALAEMEGNDFGLGAIRLIRADSLNASGDVSGAREQLRLASEIHRRTGHQVRRGVALTILGRLEGALGAFEEAEQRLREAARLLQSIGCSLHAANALDNLADVLLEQGDIDGADAAGMRGMLLLRASAEQRVAAIVEGNAGLRAWARGERDVAVVRLRESIRQVSRHGLARPARVFSCSLGAVLAEMGDRDAAREALEQGRPVGDDPADTVTFELSAAHVALALDGDRELATALLAARTPPGPWMRLDVRALARLLQRCLDAHETVQAAAPAPPD
jgi:DNA-binding winged helix-turn-helix (wHTH) protein/predicted ATPase